MWLDFFVIQAVPGQKQFGEKELGREMGIIGKAEEGFRSRGRADALRNLSLGPKIRNLFPFNINRNNFFFLLLPVPGPSIAAAAVWAMDTHPSGFGVLSQDCQQQDTPRTSEPLQTKLPNKCLHNS